MADFDRTGIGAATGTGLQGPVLVEGVANGLGLVLHGAFVASVQIKLSFDGTDFVDFEAVKTGPGYYPIPPCHTVEIDVPAFTSGTINWALGGLRSTD